MDLSSISRSYSSLLADSTSAPTLWMPEPTFRGTFGIFSLCLSTLVICVWSAIHMDIPTKRSSMLRSFISGVAWMVSALFCPEVLLFIAFNQRMNARAIVKQASIDLRSKNNHNHNETTESLLESHDDGPTRRRRRHPLTLVHGFYASMGGYVFDFVDDDGQYTGLQFLPAGCTRMSITAEGIRFLMKHDPDLIPDLSETSITDRTQASSLSKAVLLLQVLWFCTNCASRLGQGLPLSLLEVSTVAHGLCTLVTYVLWWSKPLNVAEPTTISGEHAQQACALMTMCSTKEMHLLCGTMCLRFPAEMRSITTQVQTSTPGNGESAVQRSVEREHQASVSLTPEQDILEGTKFTPKREAVKVTFQRFKTWLLFWAQSQIPPWYAMPRRDSKSAVDLKPADFHRWILASKEMERYHLSMKDLEPMLFQKPCVTSHSTLQSSADYKEQNTKGIIRSNLSAIALTLMFGLPHFLGWNAHFLTSIEQRLWRIATVAVACWGIAMASIVALIVL
ncbi:hypothetical protein WG66_007704, partial [Moniliophthora roreri]